MRSLRLNWVALVMIAGVVSLTSLSTAALGQESSADAAYQDMQKSLGMVPEFLKAFPEAGIASAWGEMKSIQMNPTTALDGKTKELIGLAVAAQIPCSYCIYFHTAAARANGATDEEIKEAIAMAAITRHWSTVLNGSQIDFDVFKQQTDAMLQHAAEMAKANPAE